ncbi:hypothetical protein Taro_008461 [Colocasia esculenta]|uniref:Uncharacterized protein n=1 Tax=Colocasia esculenta TaxID=4460 RepID=A0A843U720_COLES|nr:hypothetical protein [Colocasia esculenta]
MYVSRRFPSFYGILFVSWIPHILLFLELGLCFCTDRNLTTRSLAVKVLSWGQTMLPLSSVNGQTVPLSLVGDPTPLEETVESDSERGE